jgi:hypothetical protein
MCPGGRADERHHAPPAGAVGGGLREGSVRAAVAALAMFPQAHHHLLYAVAPTLDSSLEAGGLDSAQVQALHASIHQHAERELLLLAQGLSTRSTHTVSAEVASDVPARALLVGASMRQAPCVVMGPTTRTRSDRANSAAWRCTCCSSSRATCWWCLGRALRTENQ